LDSQPRRNRLTKKNESFVSKGKGLCFAFQQRKLSILSRK
jgi:hypothetical protein